MTSIRILSAADVRSVIPMAEAIAAVRSAFGQLSSGRAAAPLRTQLPSHGGITLVMPASVPDDQGLGAKIVSVFAGNPIRELATVTALVVLLQAETGQPLALLDGTYLTALRTGAASGVATDLLAPLGADTLAVFGAGAQARTQLWAVCTVRPIRTAWVYDPAPERAKAMISDMLNSYDGIPADLRVAKSPAQAVRAARIIVTATTSFSPVFRHVDLMPGVHINAIGAFTPEMQEIPVETVEIAKVFVDQREAAIAEAGDLIVPCNQGRLDPARLIEIGAVATGQAVGRESSDQITLFKSVGNAVQDIAVGMRALYRAEQMGLGVMVEL